LAQARITLSKAWARLVALFALALLVGVSLGVTLVVRGGAGAVALLRRVASRRRGRWDLRVVSAMGCLRQTDKSLFAYLSPRSKLDLEARSANVS
jgi:hypothetical protein